jgi:hypothetical protein
MLRLVIVLRPVQDKDGKKDAFEDDFQIFQQLLRKVLGKVGQDPVIVSNEKHTANFERYEDLKAAFRAADQTAHDHGGTPREMCIDVTAGLKIFSIAAAIATVNRDAVFSYVNNDGEVAIFDAAIEIGEMAG